jgi:hypothetical protein
MRTSPYFLLASKSSIIPKVRTKEEHEAWTRTICQVAALGPTDIWHHPEFLAMRNGFNIALTTNPNGPRFIEVSSCVCHLSLFTYNTSDIPF